MLETIQKYSKISVASFLLLANIFIWSVVRASGDSELLVYFLDVGQGDSILIISPAGNKMIIDGGPGQNILPELSKILPFHDKKIDVILATHPDADHISGFVPVLERFQVDYVIEPGVSVETRVFESFERLIENSNTQRITAQRGMKVDLGGGVNLIVFFPDRDVSGLSPNDASIVAKLYFGETNFLLLGDAPIKIEDYLVFLDGEILKSDVLKVGHHGSKTSTRETFVEKVNPQYAIISAGRDNRFGHPHAEVIEILEKFSTKILGTYDVGTILIKSDGKDFKIKN